MDPANYIIFRDSGDYNSTRGIQISIKEHYNFTGGIQISIKGDYNSTGGIQICIQGDYNSTGEIQICIQGDYNSTGGIQIFIKEDYDSNGGIQISIQGIIILLEGFRYPSQRFIIPWEGFRYSSWSCKGFSYASRVYNSIVGIQIYFLWFYNSTGGIQIYSKMDIWIPQVEFLTSRKDIRIHPVECKQPWVKFQIVNCDFLTPPVKMKSLRCSPVESNSCRNNGGNFQI